MGTNKALQPLLAVYFLIYLIGQIPGSLWIINGEDRFFECGSVGEKREL